jgi:hypothetical protein
LPWRIPLTTPPRPNRCRTTSSTTPEATAISSRTSSLLLEEIEVADHTLDFAVLY